MKRLAMLLCIMLLLCACAPAMQSAPEPTPMSTPTPAPSEPMNKQTIGLCQTEDGKCAFDINPQELFEALGEVCPSVWEETERKSTLMGYECRAYHYAYEDYLMPQLFAFFADDKLLELEVMFDEHGFSQRTYEQFEKICIAAFCLFEDKDEQAAHEMFEQLYLKSDECYTAQSDSPPEPETLFSLGQARAYSYCGAGTVSICFVGECIM